MISPKKLTNRLVESIVPGKKTIQVRDCEIPGFGVAVTPNGWRSYFLQYSVGRSGKGLRAPRRFMVIGRHGLDVSADRAREIARQWRQLARAGIDPIDALLPKKPEPSVRAVAEMYRDGYSARHHRPRSQEEMWRLFRLHIIPVLGDKPITDVRRADVADLHAKVSLSGPTAANRVLAALSGLFTFAAERELVPDGRNPARGIRKNPERKRRRFLREQQVPRFMAAVAELAASKRRPGTKLVLALLFQLLLFTGARRGELATLRWRDINMGKRFAEVDSKTGPRTIYFNRQAMEILRALEAIRVPENPYVFCGKSDGQPVQEFKAAWKVIKRIGRLDEGEDEPLVIHSLRHSFATHARNSGEDLNVIAHLLGHAVNGVTEGYAHLFSRTLQEASDRIGDEIERMFRPESASRSSPASIENAEMAIIA